MIGDDFTNIILVSNFEAAGYLVSGYIYVKMESTGKRMICLSFIASSVVSAIMLAISLGGEDGAFNASLALIDRFILIMIFNGLLLVTFTSFPIVYLCSIFCVMQLVGRLTGVLGASSTGTV